MIIDINHCSYYYGRIESLWPNNKPKYLKKYLSHVSEGSKEKDGTFISVQLLSNKIFYPNLKPENTSIAQG